MFPKTLLAAFDLEGAFLAGAAGLAGSGRFRRRRPSDVSTSPPHTALAEQKVKNHINKL